MNDSVPVDNAPQASAASLAAERYVTLTTYKRDGTPVATPVWIAARPDGALCFTTDPQSWKVKRLQRNPQVTVQACGLRGQVREGTAPRAATAEAVTGPDAQAVVKLIIAKYGFQARLIEWGGSIKARFRGTPNEVCAVVIRLT